MREAIEHLQEIDRLSADASTHRLDYFEPLIVRLEGIAADLDRDSGLHSATKKTNELVTRLVGGLSGQNSPKYRSMLASILGRYQRAGMPAKARLGGLRGGRPRKDGQPVRTLESKGYTIKTLPQKKSGRKRVHPKYKPKTVRK